MKTRWIVALAVVMAAPLSAQKISPSEAVKQMTPEERALAQQRLNSASSVFFDVRLDSAKAELQVTMKTIRDTLLVAQAEAARLQRASSPAMAMASARRLRGACQAAARTIVAAQPKLSSLRTSAKIGDDALAVYRASLTSTSAGLVTCDKTLASQLAVPMPSLPRLRLSAASVEAAADKYDVAADGVLRTLEIPLRPRGVTGGL